MDAGPFGPLAELLAGDYTVLTTDPRGINRSPVDDPGPDSTPEMRADDLSRAERHAGSEVIITRWLAGDYAGQVCDRTSRALAAELGIEPAMFPGGHRGWRIPGAPGRPGHRDRPGCRERPRVPGRR
jgi:hypothetical protein